MFGVDDMDEATTERQERAQRVTDRVRRVDDRQGDRDQAEEDHDGAARSVHVPGTGDGSAVAYTGSG